MAGHIISFFFISLVIVKGVFASSESEERRRLGNSNSYNSNSSYGSSSYASTGAYGRNFFAESSNTYYDGYQQAWRYLGHLVKCGYPSDRYYGDGSHSHSDHSGSGSGDKERKLSGSGDDNRYRGNNYCQRYLIWAAYVDLNYEGGGTGEYYYYDPYSESWDYSACEIHGNGRCAPMDCHLQNTSTWTLMGVYKEAEYFGNDAFFEQLFKHEGYCLWNDYDLYEFMSDARQGAWPEGCVSTGQSTRNAYGDYVYLYLDLKPTFNGNMSYGLYEDSICRTEYFGDQISVDSIAKSMGLLYGEYIDTWNQGLEVYKVCQPCKNYNLQNVSNYRNRRLDDFDANNDPNEGYFMCTDIADWTNVNQCMKYRTHAQLEVASWEDLVVATEQGGILDVVIGGTVFGKEKLSYDQQQYYKNVFKQAIKEEKQYTQLVASVPSPAPYLLGAKISLICGPLLLLLSLVWIYYRRLRESFDS